MQMEPSNFLATGGGLTGLVAALAYVVKMYLDWRHSPPPERTPNSAAVADAQTANAILMQTLAGLQTENARLNKRVGVLEDEAVEKDEKIEDLRARLDVIANELAELQGHS